jgi:ATP-binding cassette subfamily B protein
MKKYWKYIKPYIHYYFLGPLFMMVEIVGDVLMPYMLAQIINNGVADKDIAYIIKMGICMVFVGVMMAVGGVLGAWFAANAAMNFGADLRMDLFEKIQQFSFQNIDSFSTGSLVTRLTNDITQIQNMIMQTLRTCLRSPGILLGAIIMAFVISPRLAVIFLVVVPFLAVVIGIIMKKAFPRFRALQEKLDTLNSCIQEGLVGIRLIKSFVRGDFEEKRFDVNNKELKQANVKAMKTMLLYTPIMTLVFNITTVIVVWMGGNMIVAGTMQVGDLTAFTNYIVQIMSSMTMLSIVFLNWARAIASFKRVGEILDAKIDLTDENAAHKDKCVTLGEVEFKNVSFKYYKNNEEWVVDNISFKLEAGKTLGIIGPTGSGKTTLVSMIPRLYDADKGSILVDGTDVRDYSLTALRDGIGMVLQNNTLFSGDITENLKWGDENADDDEILKASKNACADMFIQDFKEKYNTQLGQGGSNVSGGQKQRLCIARALLKKPKILILDDSTSAVDTATEAKIRGSLQNDYKDMTQIIIAQRINSVMEADEILVLDNGRMAGFGTHEQLLAACPIYQEIYEVQFSGKE